MRILPLGVASALAALWLGGCAVPLGPQARDPFPPALVDRLHGEDRQAVRRTLGEPAAVKASGAFWLYTQRRLVAAPIGAWTGAFPERWEWLGVLFDQQGRVLFIEPSTAERGCLSNGICNRAGGEVLKRAPQSAVITAPLHQDAAAKGYLVRGGECAVYVYQQPDDFGEVSGPLSVRIGDRLLGVTDPSTYLFFTHPAGKIDLSVGPSRLSLACGAGQAVYVRGQESLPPAPPKLMLVAPPQGEAAIKVRRLAFAD